MCCKPYDMFGNFLFVLMYFMAVLSCSLWPDSVYPPFYSVIVWSTFGSLMFWLHGCLRFSQWWLQRSLTSGLWHFAVQWMGAKLHGITSQKMEGSVCVIFNFPMSTDIYRGPGFDPRRYQIFWVVVGLERGPLSLVRSVEELLEWRK